MKKLVSRFASKDIINYRKLTDNPQNEKRKTDATVVAPSVDDRTLAIGKACSIFVSSIDFHRFCVYMLLSDVISGDHIIIIDGCRLLKGKFLHLVQL